MNRNNPMSSKVLITTLSILLLALTASLVFAQDSPTMEVHSIGTGIIRGQEATAARDQAVSDAMVNAVDKAVAELISLETMAAHFQTIDEAVYLGTGDFIRDYQVMAENTSEGSYRVLVKTTILFEKLREKLSNVGALVSQEDLPQVLFLLAVQNIGDVLPQYWWGEEPSFVKASVEAAMEEAFNEKGFKVLNHEGMVLYSPEPATMPPGAETGVDTGMEQPEADPFAAAAPTEDTELPRYINNPYLNDAEALQLGNQLGVAVVVVGTARTEVVPNTIGETVRSYRTVIDVRALMVDTGEQIASIRREAVAVGADEIQGGKDSAANAGALAGHALATHIAAALPQHQQDKKNSLRILVKGTRELANFVTFRRSLGEMAGVVKMRIVEMRPDEALLEVEYQGDLTQFAEALLRRPFDSFGIHIPQIGEEQNQLDLELVPLQSETARPETQTENQQP